MSSLPGNLELYSPDYATARHRFRESVTSREWILESHPIDATGPGGAELAIDVGLSPGSEAADVLVLSSGLHGVEGFFGSAIQLAVMDWWAENSIDSVRCVMLHSLNPFGFAWLRRFNEDNVDPNRNFLLRGESYTGAPPGYAELDWFLNPACPPSRCDFEWLKALWVIGRHGIPKLRGTIAGGQYEFPKGLFFGGQAPVQTHRLLHGHLDRWLEGATRVVHLDLHSGLGPSGTCKLLMDAPLSDAHRTWLAECFGGASFAVGESSDIAYASRGGLGRWCADRSDDRDYLYACAEFGTCPAREAVLALRRENQAHHWGEPGEESTRQAKQRLLEVFCPTDAAWRSQVVAIGVDLVRRAVGGLKATPRDERSRLTR